MSITRDKIGQYTLRGKQTEEELLEVAEDILLRRLKRIAEPLEDPAATARFLRMALAGYPYEVFGCLFLDNRHGVIAFEELFRGSVANTEVHPREVIRRCIHHNAAAVIFSHNHPSGHCEPSSSDRVITQKLKEALGLIDVRVLDHFVVGPTDTVSMALRGWV